MCKYFAVSFFFCTFAKSINKPIKSKGLFVVKQKVLYVIFMLAFAVGTKAAWSDYTPERPVIFGTAIDYPPLEYVDPDGMPCGFDIEFTKELMKRLSLPIANQALPWGNIPRAAIDGKIDLALMTFSPYRKDSIYYSRSVFKLYYQVVYRNDEASKHIDMRRLAGKKVAYLSSKPVSDTLTAVGAVPLIVPNLRQAMQDLSKGEYDAVICYRYQAKFLIGKYSLSNLIYEDFTLTPREYCYVSHDQELIELINEKLDEMEAENVIYNMYSPAGVYLDIPDIPMWVWYLLVAVIILFLVIFIILQQLYQQKLRREIKRAQRSEQAKTVFLSNVSHVLRTPLNAINGFSYILCSDKDGSLSAEERIQLASMVHENGELLLYFIDELLTLTEIETSEMKLNRSEVELSATIASYIEEGRSSLHDGVELQAIGPKDCRVFVDEKMMHIVIKHFLDNAIKHTDEGKVTLTYRIDRGRLYVEVKDTGCGVPVELRKNIFSLASEKAVTVQSDIPGLGLTICRAVIEYCKGEIGLISPPEGGACFWFLVPVKVLK